MAKQAVLAILCSAAMLAMGQSCVTVTNNGPGPDGDDTGEPGQITVRLVNATNQAVDVQLHATGQAVSDLDAEFFIPAHQIVAGIGFAGSGLLEAGQTDEVVLPCTDAAILGTRGGRFLDRDTGEEIGAGTRYVLFLGGQFQCGGTIVFTYAAAGTGFQTGLSIIPPG